MTQLLGFEAALAAAIFWRAGSTGGMCCARPAGSRCSRRCSRSQRSPRPATTRRWCSAASTRACRSRSRIHRRTRLTGKYSQFVIAGAAIGVVAPAFKDWHKTFWDNLATSIQLHNIKKVIAIDHRDCGAAKIAYGEAAVATKDAETETHRKALAEFRKQVNEKQPKLGVETGLMAINGKFERLG